MEKRAQFKKWFIDMIDEIQEIVALVEVGSGASGELDDYSDVDLIAVVEEPHLIEIVNDIVKRQIVKLFPNALIKVYKHHEKVTVTCFFLDNYLELDLGIWTLDMLHPTKPHFNIIFDYTHQVNMILSKYKAQDAKLLLQERVEDQLSSMWQHVDNAVIALKRKQHIKCKNALDVMVNQIVEVLGLKAGYTYDFDKKIDRIDDPDYDTLIEILGKNQKQQLLELTDLYFKIIDDQSHKSIKIIRDYLEMSFEVDHD